MALTKIKLGSLREKIEAPIEVKKEKKLKVKKEETPEEKSDE